MMIRRFIAVAFALSFLDLLAVASDAEAKRRCPSGQEDSGNVCR
jgi:hypothetical protein